jgi:hypothetical protein
MIPYELGWYWVEFVQDVAFKISGKKLEIKVNSGKRVRLEIKEDRNDSVFVVWEDGGTSVLKKSWFRRVRQ